jgi:hypothetical protein
MRVPDLLICKFLAVNALSSSSILIGGITTLSHKSLDDSMENVFLVMIEWTFISNTYRSEVLGCLWNLFGEQFKYNSTVLFVLIVICTDLDIKESLRIFKFELW